MLPSQVCHAAARTEVPILCTLNALAIMQREACAAPLQLNDIPLPQLHAVPVALWLDTLVIALLGQHVPCTVDMRCLSVTLAMHNLATSYQNS